MFKITFQDNQPIGTDDVLVYAKFCQWNCISIVLSIHSEWLVLLKLGILQNLWNPPDFQAPFLLQSITFCNYFSFTFLLAGWRKPTSKAVGIHTNGEILFSRQTFSKMYSTLFRVHCWYLSFITVDRCAVWIVLIYCSVQMFTLSLNTREIMSDASPYLPHVSFKPSGTTISNNYDDTVAVASIELKHE